MMSLRIFGEDICKNSPLNKNEVKGSVPEAMVIADGEGNDDEAEKLGEREGNAVGGGLEDEEGAQNA